MCGRYVQTLSPEQFELSFGISSKGLLLRPRYNIAPTTKIPVIRRLEGLAELAEMRWGLIPSWAKPGAKLPLMINARAETVVSKPTYRAAFKKRRCIVPATGYYEWLNTANGKQPYYITRKDGNPIAFAGLWEYSPEENGSPSVTIITTTSNPDTTAIHDRMPVILETNIRDSWMSDEMDLTEAERLLHPSETGTLVSYMVSTRVNSIRNEGADLLATLKPPLTGNDLFDMPLNPL